MAMNPFTGQTYRKGAGANRLVSDPADALVKNSEGHVVEVDTPDEDPLEDIPEEE